MFMNVRIFWVHAMKCMCAQTRPRFILSSEKVLGGMEFEPMLTPREKSPLPENFPRGGLNPRRCGQRAQTLPTSYSGPLNYAFKKIWKDRMAKQYIQEETDRWNAYTIYLRRQGKDKKGFTIHSRRHRKIKRLNYTFQEDKEWWND